MPVTLQNIEFLVFGFSSHDLCLAFRLLLLSFYYWDNLHEKYSLIKMCLFVSLTKSFNKMSGKTAGLETIF